MKLGSLERQSILSLILLVGIVFAVHDDGAPAVASAQEITSASTVFPAYAGPDPAEAAPTTFSLPNAVPQTSVETSGPKEYLEVTNGCLHGWDGCIIARSGPGEEYDGVYEIEKGMLLPVNGSVESHGQTWYRVYFDEWRRYPERTPKTWYVPASAGRIIHAGGVEISSSHATTSKRVVVDISDQMLYAYDGDQLFMSTKVSTGEYPTVTPTGTFTVYKKTPTRYMQGPLAGVTNVPFDLPGVPWNMYFTQGGAVIHGTYWHDQYGTEESSGCVNLPVGLAKTLYQWAPLGTTVVVQK